VPDVLALVFLQLNVVSWCQGLRVTVRRGGYVAKFSKQPGCRWSGRRWQRSAAPQADRAVPFLHVSAMTRLGAAADWTGAANSRRTSLCGTERACLNVTLCAWLAWRYRKISADMGGCHGQSLFVSVGA
jgi:hypothetical protein